VNGPSLVSPLVQLKNGNILFERKWSQEHSNFADIINWIYSELGVEVNEIQAEYVLITDIRGSADFGEVMWVRCQLAPIFMNAGYVKSVRWTILSF